MPSFNESEFQVWLEQNEPELDRLRVEIVEREISRLQENPPGKDMFYCGFFAGLLLAGAILGFACGLVYLFQMF